MKTLIATTLVADHPNITVIGILIFLAIIVNTPWAKRILFNGRKAQPLEAAEDRSIEIEYPHICSRRLYAGERGYQEGWEKAMLASVLAFGDILEKILKGDVSRCEYGVKMGEAIAHKTDPSISEEISSSPKTEYGAGYEKGWENATLASYLVFVEILDGALKEDVREEYARIPAEKLMHVYETRRTELALSGKIPAHPHPERYITN